MSAPYFKVGEEVILVSVDMPEFNCETTVESIFMKDDLVFETQTTKYWARGLEYRLAIDEDRPGNLTWCQTALRKKHQGGEDFKSLMNHLKSPISQGEVHE